MGKIKYKTPDVKQTASKIQMLPAAFEQYNRNSLKKDVNIQKQRAFLYVEIIIFQLMFGLEIILSPHLCQARDAGFHDQSHSLEDFVLFDKVRPFRSWPNQTHIPFQDVE